MRTTILRTLIGTAAISATAGMLPLGAQVIREGARTSPKDAKEVQVTFGYLCDDRFVVRNEGDDPLRLEYGLAKNDERTSLSLDARESVELLLDTSDELDLFAGGKVIGSAVRDYRDCRDMDDNAHVVVRPLVVEPTVVIAPYHVYRVYRPYYGSWYRPYFRPYYHPIVQAVFRIPISIGHRDSDRGRSSGGDRGRSSGGDRGRSSGGDRGHSSGGDRGHPSGGDRGRSGGGDRGHDGKGGGNGRHG